MATNQSSKKKFAFSTAFMILFLLLIVIAFATLFVPASSYDYDEEGAPLPGTYHEVESNPQKLLKSALMDPITGMYGIQDETSNVDVWNSSDLYGAIDVAMFVQHRQLHGHDHEDRHHQRRNRLGGGFVEG